ncbi:MAG: class I tRNA ligase family protein, partial [Patescibacteria group bacterium]|nr:class I tRNA ligase family protein [Patescibacteria group bacterium]
LQMYDRGLAYESYEPVNWCPKDKTVLANEDVEDGRCERCGTPVEKKRLRQWVLKITDYADRLLKDLDAIDTDNIPHIIDKAWPPRAGKKRVERRTIHAIVRDPKTEKYLGLKWKKFPWTTFVIGGVGPGEDIVEAARREVEEETGYHDLRFVRVLGGPVKAEYFAAHKDQNRVAITSAVLFELNSDSQKELVRESHEDFDVTWLDIGDIKPCAELPVWKARLGVDVEYDRNTGVPCFIDATKQSYFKEGVPVVERKAIAAVVKHWKEDKYIGLKWKKVDWQTLITGGAEGDQTQEEGAIQEIIEETGYLHPKLKRHLGKVESKFFHNPKNVNRYAKFDVMCFELRDGERRELTPEEQANHDVVWLSKEEMEDFLSPAAHIYMWQTLFLGKPSWFQDKARPLLDWPESIKEAQRNWIGRSEGAEIDFRLTMTKNKTRFVIIHGYGGSAGKNFIPWLKAELEKRGHDVETPELPNTKHPIESEQVDHVLKNCRLDENTVVIGHSLGAVVAMKALMKLKKPISGLVLVAAAMDPKHGKKHREYWEHFDFKFEYDLIRKLTGGKIAILSDSKEPQRRPYLKALSDSLEARLVETTGVEEHFCADQEPEVLKAVTPSVTVFTTRPDTLFGVTYLVLAPEHPWIEVMKPFIENKAEVDAYIGNAARESEIERTSAEKEKTGVELKGIKAVNPANNEEVPVWIADYVLPDYGTGAVMAVPAHDERDYAFAKKFGLP